MSKAKSNLLRNLFSSLSKEVNAHRKTSGTHGYNRRTFLKQSVTGALGLGIALNTPFFLSSCSDKENNILDVAILGGGIAGLNCANHLLNSGLNFKVFEASNRLGGRILTHYNDSLQLGIHPEFGGEFIDSNHLDMLSLAKEFNLELVDLIAEQEVNNWVKDIYYFDNRKISEEEIINEFKKIAPQLAKDIDSLGEDYDTEEAQKLDYTPLSEYIDALPCATWLKDLLTAAFVAEYGLDCEDQSTINMLDMLETDTSEGFFVFGDSDERFRIKEGNSKIIEGLAQKIGQDKIEINHIVTEINEDEYGNYKIIFDGQNSIKAKMIVCTIPFTILRNLKLNLSNMPEEKRKCIDELGYGTNTKLVLGYEGQPWRSEENNAMGYLFTNDMTNGWDSSLVKTPNNDYGAYIAYFGGKFSKKLSEQSFKNKMAPPNHSWRTELPEETVKGFVEQLDKIFIGSKAKFTENHVFVNWLDYPWVKASYTCYKVGQWSEIAGWESEPIGNFYFAGEHCSEMFQGFMNGAAESGREAAESILMALAEKS